MPKRETATHEVVNQPPPLAGDDAFAADAALRSSLPAGLDTRLLARLHVLGTAVGEAAWIARGFQANEYPPRLRSFDRQGKRIDEVTFHPAWHALMALGMEQGTHSLAWTEPRHGHVVHAALQYLLTQLEPGVCCPLAMSHAAVPVLRRHLPERSVFVARAAIEEYDPRFVPAGDKRSLTFGMAMTEKQGGSDVRANSTLARPLGKGREGREYVLRGHKWFCSAPMSDAFLTLAQAPGGLSCFLVPRWHSDGSRNPFLIQRLKDKLGNRSNASAEIEYDGTRALRLGEEGAGIGTIIEMVQHTRLDAAVAPAGMMRQALVQAIHHARHRHVFGKALAAQPLMRNVLVDLAVESEAATRLAMRLAGAVDAASGNERERDFARLATIVAKYWINRQAPAFVCEAMECLGGGGYIEESLLPRLYREAPLNGIWEGSGNVMCLDLLRVLERTPASLEAFDAEVADALGEHRVLRERHARMHRDIARCRTEPALARRCLESMALVLQAALLCAHAPGESFSQFVAGRLDESRSRSYGTLEDIGSADAILARAWPG